MPVFTYFLFLFSSFSFSLARYNDRESLVSRLYRSISLWNVKDRGKSRALFEFSPWTERYISRSWDRSKVDIVSGLSTCTRVSSIRSDHGAASRRCFRRFALVCHNCFRPSSRLRHLDIVSFRYFRFQAHRSMSAPLPSTRLHYSPGNVCFYARLARLFIFLSRIFNVSLFFDFSNFENWSKVKFRFKLFYENEYMLFFKLFF